MSTFYVLPPRECLEQATSEFVARILPGVSIPTTLWEDLLGFIVTNQTETYFVHREDLAGEKDLTEDLMTGFGAEQGDAVVEVGLSLGSSAARLRHWVVPTTVSDCGVNR